MKVLLIDCGGNFLDFALRCMNAGHEVKTFIPPDKNGNRLSIGDGLIERVNDFHKWMRWADIVLLSDNARYIHQLESYRKYGYPIIGAPIEGAEWELNRTFGQKILKDAGGAIMPYKTFTDYDEAERYVIKNMKRYVSKPSGDADKALSYVSKSPADMVYMLRHWKRLGKVKQPFILQEFRPGIEMAIGGWFGKNGWNDKFLVNFEHKKFMNADLGVNTGEQGTVMQYVDSDKLAEKLLIPVSQSLMDIGYTGYVDAAAIIGEDGSVNFLEWTMRFGWPCFQIQSALHIGDPVNWLRDLIDGYDSLRVRDQVATGVVVSIPDYPYNKKPREQMAGYPVYCDHGPSIAPCEIKAGVAPHDVDGKIVDSPCWVTAGGYVLVATGLAETVSGSARRAYGAISKIEIPNSPGWRTDIGKRLQEQLPKLHALGFAKQMKY